MHMHAIEGQPLTLVNRHGPRELQRQLLVATHHLLANVVGFIVVPIFELLPLLRLDGHDGPAVELHDDAGGADGLHLAQ